MPRDDPDIAGQSIWNISSLAKLRNHRNASLDPAANGAPLRGRSKVRRFHSDLCYFRTCAIVDAIHEMKLRMNESSVRLRLRRSEVEQFAREASIESATPFPDGRTLRVRLIAADVNGPLVSFTGEVLEVSVPKAASVEWTSSAKVEIFGRHGSLEILVEKDFRRTSLPSPDDEDRYPNPRSPK